MKNIFAILLAMAVMGGVSSCVSEEDDIFEESSAQRLNHAISNYQEILMSAPNGWVMEYVANEIEPGYPMLVKFGTNGGVTIAAKNHYSSNNVYAEETSSWEMLGSNGPVLTFNTYNSLLHIFSTPEDIPDTGTDEDLNDEQGLGHEGDYEFVVVSADADHVQLRGTKHGLTINMFRLADDLDWTTYYDQIDAIKTSYFSKSIPSMILTVGNERFTIEGYTLANGTGGTLNDGIVQFYPEGGDPISQSTVIPYFVRLDGTLHLSTPYEGENEAFAVQDFTLGDDGLLHSTGEGQDAIIKSEVDQLLQSGSLKWRWNKNALAGEFATVYQKLENEIRAANYGTLQYLELSYDSSSSRIVLSYRTSRGLNGKYYFATKIDGETVSLEYAEGDTNASVFYERVNAMQELLQLMSTTFNVTPDAPLAVSTLTFADSANQQNSFNAKLS